MLDAAGGGLLFRFYPQFVGINFMKVPLRSHDFKGLFLFYANQDLVKWYSRSTLQTLTLYSAYH
ncbi:hypothetical protein DSM03_101744 [Leeuwenhoekiella aestuarii]|uniref:Uncharacterized protein n=1 Tax=Leeuwenhoekiella aestuarii TaxID=2249426 RepID=A0A4Q0NYS7_9FLAO|nr:hypothetical protein DSM04_101252 [Leeuwenhoekiella aestuarii]RXG19370.1 hypothetical protein DSM03_101744 [Leeuwenhoekiella aestuarii]